MRRAFAPAQRRGPGTLYGVGLGPGDPGLLTLKGRRILRSAPLVCVPATPPGRSVARSLAEPHVRGDRQELRELGFAPRAGHAQWRRHARALLVRLRAGDDVVFACEGDVTLYSTFARLAAAVRALDGAVPVVFVPGVSSFQAAAAAAGQPLALGEESLAVVPTSAGPERVRGALETHDSVVLLKVADRLDGTLDLLDALGLAGQAVLASRCGLPGERVTRDVGGLRGNDVDYLSLLIVRRAP